MRKQFVLSCICIVLSHFAVAQPGQLMIKGYGKDLHLDHTVAAKEGLFAIGRLYNVSPRTIAAYNKIDMAKGLSVGQVVRIPLTDTNFSQRTIKGIPVYYKTGEKETLQKVSNLNNKVSLQSLRDWNKLANDNVTAGKKLIVGYLVSGENATAMLTTPDKKENLPKETDKPAVVNGNTEQDKTAIKKDTKKDDAKKVTEEKQTAKTETDKPVAKNNEAANKPATKKEESKKTETVVTKPQVTTDMTGQGFFKPSFDQQVKTIPISKTETVTSGVFKMVNGPQDAKFYLLADGVSPGTIIRVINPDNNKAIYAKVLGEMSGIRENQGFDIRISNAAATSLGITDMDKFIVKINY